MKQITFVLPTLSKRPIGGYKIVFEYANRLSTLGYNVTIIFPFILSLKNNSLKNIIKTMRKYYFKGYFIKRYSINWFETNKKIKLKVVPSLDEKYIPEGDIIFATARETSKYVNLYSKNKGEKFYLIQGYENWDCTDKELLSTWKYPLKKIVISKWLAKIAEDLNEKYRLIYNGLDFENFNIINEIEKRERKTLLCLYHEAEWKGFKYGLESFKYLKEKYPDIKIICFGAYKRSLDLPEWIEYYHQPSISKLRELYNQSSIFLGTSLGEGWGLTVAEAMQCGCAVVCTDVNGYNEMVFNYKTGLLCESQNSIDMSNKIEKLLKDDELRIKLAKAGNLFIQKFTWDRAVNKLIEVIE